jgi:hypothetical protein
MKIPIFLITGKRRLSIYTVCKELHVCYHKISDDALHTMSILKVGLILSTKFGDT